MSHINISRKVENLYVNKVGVKELSPAPSRRLGRALGLGSS